MRIVYTENAPKPIGPYSQAVAVNGMIYFSGQIALDAKTGEFLNGDVAEQTKKVCENIKALLESEGLSFNNVVKTTCFLTKMEHFASFSEVYSGYFLSKPARSTIAVFELPKGALVEIEVIATTNI